MKKVINKILIGLSGTLAFMAILTLLSEGKGKSKTWEKGDPSSLKKVLIIYDPDFFYNLDQQVCEGFGKALADSGWHVTFATVAAASKLKIDNFILYVFCANTYYWSPDWAITGFIKKNIVLKDKNVVAITVGGSDTKRAKRILEDIIKENGGILVGSETYWLLKPNDESRMKESNIKIAVEMAEKFGGEIIEKIKLY
jgi:hypothetical protein